jgi:hypothetical protein
MNEWNKIRLTEMSEIGKATAKAKASSGRGAMSTSEVKAATAFKQKISGNTSD